MSPRDELAFRRAEILRLSRLHGATNVRVFGSFARDAARAESDLDLLVDVGPRPSAFFPGGLVADLEELLGRPVDVLTEGAIHPLLRARILAEAVPL
jgi:predicted nucleotidyltransferase